MARHFFFLFIFLSPLMFLSLARGRG